MALGIGEKLRRLQADMAVLPVVDRRSDDEIIGYDADGVPGDDTAEPTDPM